MFDYDLELKKFKPAVGVEIGEDELFSDDIKDITDLVEELDRKSTRLNSSHNA